MNAGDISARTACARRVVTGAAKGALWVAFLLVVCCLMPEAALAIGDDSPSGATPSSTGSPLAVTGGEGSLPARFDLREKGVVSPVKNQEPWGTCWAFGSTAASEASILSELGTTYAKNPLDLSVRHLAWFAGSALPDSATMKTIPGLAPYASQAREGTTVRSTGQNEYAHPLETGGFAFYAACAIAAGMGPVSAVDVPYKNDEDMAEYVFNENDAVANLKPGQTLDDFLKNNPGVYHRFAQIEPSNAGAGEGGAAGGASGGGSSADPSNAGGSGKDGGTSGGAAGGASGGGTANEDDEVVTTTPRQERLKVTPELAKAGLLSHYAVAPIFDAQGKFIPNDVYGGPVYIWGVAEQKRFSRTYELEECHVLPQPTGGYEGQQYAYDEKVTQAIKRELFAGRGVVVSVFDDSASRVDDDGYSRYTNTNTWSQYTFDADGTNKIHGAAHIVCIVGWDDNWGTDKFVPGSIPIDGGASVSRTPPAAGAWIVKNSYGAEGAGFPNEGTIGYKDESGKHTGYFYLSYYDMGISRPTSFDYDVTGHVSDIINQYDLMPAPVAYAEKYNDETTFANVFTAEEDQVVHALSVESELPNTHAKLELRRLAKDAATPAGGELLATVEGDFEWGGFYRLRLAQGCALKAGERFAVVGRLTTPKGDGVTYQVPVHRDVNEQSIEMFGNAIETYVTGVVNKGESYLCAGGVWKDWSDCIAEGKRDGTLVKYYDYDNFPLKAYADVVSEPQPEPAPAGGEVGKSYKVAGSTYKVTSNAKMEVKFTRAKSAKTFKVPASVVIGGRAYKVTAIGAKAFSSAKKKLKSAVIGKNVRAIGKRAFAGCKKLTTLVVKTKLLKKKSTKKCLAGSSVKVVKVKAGKAKVNRKYAKKYAKIFTKKNCGTKVTVKG